MKSGEMGDMNIPIVNQLV